jgi:hypothetical protein
MPDVCQQLQEAKQKFSELLRNVLIIDGLLAACQRRSFTTGRWSAATPPPGPACAP